MNPYRQQFLSLRHLPGRLTAEETSWFLGFNLHDIPVLIAAGLLKPLGQPIPNAVKYFDLITLNELKQNTNWQSRATKEIMGHWRRKNLRKSEAVQTSTDLRETA